MKKYLGILSFFLISTLIYSQSCLPEGITFISQSQVDSFQINNPGCTTIEGDLIIGPVNSWDEIDISNLDSLIVLTSIEGDLKVWNNDLLSNLSGLDSLNDIGGSLIVETNSSVENLIGLENLNSIGGVLNVYGGNYITSLSGLDNLTTIGGNLVISYNNALNDLTSLHNVTSIGGEFNVISNASLTTLSGLDNIEESSITSMVITNNANLSMCSVESVCAYLVEGSWGINIGNNTTGCDNTTQVNDACGTVGMDEVLNNLDFSIYPNPAKDILYLSSTNSEKIDEVSISNQIGQEMIRLSNTSIIDVSSLTPGSYIIEVKVGEERMRSKILIE